MKLYLSQIQRRQIPGYRTHLDWSDHLLGFEAYRSQLWSTYRRLRQAGFDKVEARWIIWDMACLGRLADRRNDFGEVES